MEFEHLSIAGFLEAVEPVTSTEIAGERVGWSSFRRARTCGDGRGPPGTASGSSLQNPSGGRWRWGAGHTSGWGGLWMEIDYMAGNYYGC